ncbi:hypothetical protein HMPREF0666_00379 [Prevotella sp. C561]|uniref:DUF6850 family outer membrane beta-barrel protein n=1 Tax=Prevotella sp. C561 TaxID=563031 RepID=UPI0002238603|nr:DUF6850 family outer membrane beta-barrel protein [Prevotella sp. C561]EGW48495.1 hypothetical protein HMPREF0666_00379 [Prevotella sp. C561]
MNTSYSFSTFSAFVQSSLRRGWGRLFLLMFTLPTMAQTPSDSLVGEPEYRYKNLTQLWHNTSNAAGLSLDDSPNRGFASIGFNHRGGDYHRVQEGGAMNNMQFFTERYQRLGRYLYSYGKVDFNLGRTKDRAFADQYRPYNSNPYQSGSDIAGSYDHQDFDMVASVGTTDFSGWRFGLQLNYQLGDLSRFRDPRSRSQLLDYRLTPSVSYTMGGHTLGLSGYYDRRKEKMGPLVTVQSDATLTYYLFSGMEYATGTIGGYSSFNREWVNHQVGAAMDYGYRSDSFHTLNSFGISRGEEYAYGTYKYEPGRYFTYLYNVQSQNRLLTGSVLHQVDVRMDWQQGYADEYRQQLIIKNDPQIGTTSYTYEKQLEFRKRYQVRTFDCAFRYRANFLNDAPSRLLQQATASLKGYTGFSIDTHKASNRHLLPLSSSDYSRINFQLENGISLFKQHLTADLTLGYSVSTRADLQLADDSSILAQRVLLKDLPYYDANLFHGRLQVMYQFPLTIKKSRAMWFVKAFGDFTSANSAGHPNLYNVGFSVGLFN